MILRRFIRRIRTGVNRAVFPCRQLSANRKGDQTSLIGARPATAAEVEQYEES